MVGLDYKLQKVGFGVDTGRRIEATRKILSNTKLFGGKKFFKISILKTFFILRKCKNFEFRKNQIMGFSITNRESGLSWTVLGQSGRSAKVDGPEIQKWTVQRYETGRS